VSVAKSVRTIHYVNQFFGGMGGEEQADVAPQWFEGPKGPGQLIQGMAPGIDIVGTIIAGDNYMAENLDDAVAEIVGLLEAKRARERDFEPDLLLAGPAFNAGRYGMACGAICRAVQERLEIPAVTAMYEENPAVEIYRRSVTIVRTGRDVMAMGDAAANMVRVGLKLVAGEAIVPAADGTIAHGRRQNYFAEATGARRAIDMLLRKLNGEAIGSEYPMPTFSRVAPAPAVGDMSAATLALVTSGGIVPRGNPDRIESANASKFGAYPLQGLDRLSADTHQSVHGGYDPTYANDDPNRVLPLDVVRDLEREGRIGRLSETYYATVGNATSVERAQQYGQEIAAELVNVGVQAVILTST
jgi:glycine reductase